MEANKNLFLKSILAISLIASGAACAVDVTSGQLVIINSLGNAPATGNPGATPSAFSIVVSDSTGPCATIANVAYNGTSPIIKWSASATHSNSSCTDITSVAITPLKSIVGSVSTIIYDSVSTTTVPTTTATAAITFTAPTTKYSNLSLIVNGSGVPASAVTASATTWGVGAAVAPVFSTGNGALSSVGVPGAVGAYGLKAENMMRRYAILPFNIVTD